ncbi:MAG: class I SAM-dependent methyltransferase [Longimicrobiales bacterium]
MAKSQRFRKFRKSSKTWDAPVLPLILGLIGGLFAALAVGALQETTRGLTAFARGGSLAPVWAFLFGFVAVGLPILAIQKAALRVIHELRAYINIRPFTGERLVGTDLWAMDAVFAENLVQQVNERPGRIVELGSGHSSVLIAQRLGHLGAGHLTAVDHLEEFADRTRGWIEDRGLGEVATVVHAPIAEHEIDGEVYPWYSMEVLEARLPEIIDLLVVDGPPGKIGKDARWPAVPLLKDRLAPGAVVLLDDGDRADETRIAYSWRDILGGEIRYLPGGKGGWLIRAGG